MIELTQAAVNKVLEIISKQDNRDNISGLRISVVGGGCSGFSYSMAFVEGSAELLDKTFEFEDKDLGKNPCKLKVFVDQASLLYLDGVKIDYTETLEGAGFKFNNPNAKSTCGCGSSFQA